jgi:hypothetical protein
MLGVACSGQDSFDFANMTNPFVVCGILRGAPQRLDNGPPLIWNAGSRWSSPLYSCATTIKANIKTVNFRLNGTEGLKSLTVDSITEKTYKDNASAPLWGMEDSGRMLAEMRPVWGLVSPDYHQFPNVSTVRKPSFYLPGYSGGGIGLSGFSEGASRNVFNLPASEFYLSALGGTYGGFSYGDSVPGMEASSNPQLDYTGHSNAALFRRWQRLSASETGIASIINLIWTDLAAPSVVGTKSVRGQGNAGAKNGVSAVQIRPFVRKIKYTWAWAIPAFILAAVLVVITLVDIAFAALGIVSMAIMRKRLQQTSPGRIYSSLVQSGDVSLESPRSADWARRNGQEVVEPELVVASRSETSGLLGSGKEDDEDSARRSPSTIANER